MHVRPPVWHFAYVFDPVFPGCFPVLVILVFSGLLFLPLLLNRYKHIHRSQYRLVPKQQEARHSQASWKCAFGSAHSGHTQSSGSFSNGVPGAISADGSPFVGSYSYPHPSQTISL